MPARHRAGWHHGPVWSPADTVETVAAVAEVLVAAGTGFLAWKTHGLAAETKKMAAETKRVAEAAEQQANAAEALVKETQQDRELAWSPFLTLIRELQNCKY